MKPISMRARESFARTLVKDPKSEPYVRRFLRGYPGELARVKALADASVARDETEARMASRLDADLRACGWRRPHRDAAVRSALKRHRSRRQLELFK